MNDNLGKQAEQKIKEWLNKPEDGYCFDRIPDRMTGFYGDNNICDFTLYKYPEMYWIESKATWESRFDFARLSPNQYDGLLAKSKIEGVHGLVIVLFATSKRAFILDIRNIDELIKKGTKSININKIDKWAELGVKYAEIPTQDNARRKLLDYVPGTFVELVNDNLA